MTKDKIERQYAIACLFLDLALVEGVITAGEWVGTTLALQQWRRNALLNPDTAREIDTTKLDAAMQLWGVGNVLPFPDRFDRLRSEAIDTAGL